MHVIFLMDHAVRQFNMSLQLFNESLMREIIHENNLNRFCILYLFTPFSLSIA